jgi:uncharacterized linocin/CFP29 family protein
VNHLLRSHAPISDAGWTLVDEEARQRLAPGLAARRLVDFDGPHGWTYSATNLGRLEAADSSVEGVHARRRRVLPLVELRAPFTIARDELRDGDRGAEDVDLDDLDRAARQMAEAENALVFHGTEDGIEGIIPASPHPPMRLGEDPSSYTGVVARAVDVLKRNGLEGPYGLALSREQWTHVVETAEHGGYPLFEHLALILGGPIVWAPGVRGAVVLSLRGGDFLLEVGQDLAIGYESHDGDVVELYLEESLSFRSVTPEAAVAIEIAPV